MKQARSNGQIMSSINGNGLNVRSYLELHGKALRELPSSVIDAIGDELFHAYEEGRRVLLFGNGGSASLASHFACDLGKGTVYDGLRKRFQVMSLTDNMVLVTAWANDASYEQIFAEQLRNFVQPGDIALAISASGNSPNVLLGLEVAHDLGAYTIGLTGFEGGKMKALCRLCAIVPSDNMQIIEDLHVCIAHALFTAIRQRILMVASEFVQAATR